MDFQMLESLRRTHPAWRLLVADHAPLIVSFLNRAFIQPNMRTLPQQELVSRLEEYLYSLRQQAGDSNFPKSAGNYLNAWASDEHGWLRKYYVQNDDEPHYDLTPATERAIDWLASLGQRQFVGTESRLLSVFSLLREMAEGTEVDPVARISELERRKAQIDLEIQRIQEGRMFLMDATQIKDRFLQMSLTARSLLSDFREVEGNFRELDRAVRERIAAWEGGKGALLEKVFGERDAIADSDQGKSFRSFWEFLMSPARQDELTEMLRLVFALDPVKDLTPDSRLLRVHYDWLEAGEEAQRTVARLSEQLRRYVDDQSFVENRRIVQLIREIEQHALAVRDGAPAAGIMEVEEPAPDVDVTMDRPLFTPPFKPSVAQQVIAEGDQDFSASPLFEQTYVDKMELTGHIRFALQARSQISLGDLVESRPLRQGLAELITYMSLAAEDPTAVIDDRHRQRFYWTDSTGQERRATTPLVIFSGQSQPQKTA